MAKGKQTTRHKITPEERRKFRERQRRNVEQRNRSRMAGDPYTVPQFAQSVGVSLATLYRHLPKMRVIKFGKRTLIPEEEKQRYLEACVREPSEPVARLKRRRSTHHRAAGAP